MGKDEASSTPAEVRPDAEQTAEVRSELHEYLEIRQARRSLFPRAALVGLLSGAVAVLFRALLAGGDALRNNLISWSQTFPRIGWVFPALFGAAGAAGAVWLVRRSAPEASGSGIPHLEAVLRRYRELRWWRVLPVKLIGGALAIGGGLALGREGPTVQMGGSVGDAVARRFSVTTEERLILTAAGAGAGLAAAFNAPLSGLVFVLEELQRDFRAGTFGSAFLAAAIADIVARLVSGQLPSFSIPSYPSPPLMALPAFALLGLVTGVFGVGFNKALLRTLDRFSRWTGRRSIVAAAFVGAAAGVLGWIAPNVVGGGHGLAEQALAGQVVLAAIPLLLIARLALTLTSYGTGAPGGIFAPLLALGALLGLGFGLLARSMAPSVVSQPAVFAVVGMAATFTAIVRAPLTGVVLIVEMTGNYAQMLPLLIACFCAYAAAEALRDLPIYEALLARDLQRSGVQHTHAQPLVIELAIEPRAPFDGRAIRELGLPPGCLIVRCRDGGEELVPTADTRLYAHMRITAVVAPESEGGLTALRAGCEASNHCTAGQAAG